MTLVKEIVDWVEENVDMSQFIHPQWRSKLIEWGLVDVIDNTINFIWGKEHKPGDDPRKWDIHSDDEVGNGESVSKDKEVRMETKYLYPYSQAERDYENSL